MSVEPILFSGKIFKINRWSLKQERILVLTVRSVYVFRKKCIPHPHYSCLPIELRKKLLIEDLGCVIKSIVPHSTEFILHFPNFFDLRIQSDRRESFLDLIKLRFAHLQPSTTLRIYGIVSLALV